MEKTLISIVGPTTVGKSTLASTLLDVSEDIYPVPLFAVRSPRSDDDARLTQSVNENQYKQENMFVDDYPYGIPVRYIHNFIASKHPYALSIGTPAGLSVVTNRLSEGEYSRINRCNIVITFNDNLGDELTSIFNRIDEFFPDKEKNEWRKRHHLKFAEEYFYNAEYLDRDCDIRLIQKDTTVVDWYDQIAERLVPLAKVDRSLLAKTIKINMIRR